jgi:hypothetical protein
MAGEQREGGSWGAGEATGEVEREAKRWRDRPAIGAAERDRPAIGATERDRPATDLVSGVNSVFIQEQWVRERERMYLSPFFYQRRDRIYLLIRISTL